jgi:hypothetical protein
MVSAIHFSSSAHQYLYGECHGEKKEGAFARQLQVVVIRRCASLSDWSSFQDSSMVSKGSKN